MLRKLEFSQGVALLGQKACPSRERNPWPLPLPPFDELWTEVRRTFQDGKCWQDGPGNCVPVLAAALQRVLADLASPSLPQKWNPLEAAVLFHVLGTVGHQYPKNGDLMVEAVIAGGGLPLAIEALLQSLSLEAGGSPSCRWITRIRQEMAWYQRSNYRCWLPVRRQLTRASPADYEEAKSYALARRAHGTLQSRCLLAYAFADEPWWSDELDEVLATPPMHHGFKIYQDGGFALLANCTDLARARELCLGGNHRPEPQQAWNMALLLGDEVAPLLLELAKHQVEFLDPLVHLPSLSTAMAMKVCLDDRKQRAYAAAYYQTHPSLGMHALAQVVQAGGKLADVARSLLGGLLGGHPELVADLPERERATCEAVLAKRSRRLPEAPADAIPAMLTAPPWKAKRSKTRVTIIDGLSPPAYEDRIHWKSGRPQGYRFEPPPPQGADRRQLIALEAIIADPKGQVCLWNLETVAQDNALRLFRESDVEVWRKAWDLENSSTVLARFGLDGVPRLLELADLEPAKLFSTLELIESPGVAPHMARALGMQKNAKAARAWLTRYPKTAVLGLIPRAVGKPGKPRAEAEAALRLLASLGHRELVLEVAEDYGAESALVEVLEFDPLQLYPDKLPKLPDFCKLDRLPRPSLRGGRYALSEAALETLLQMLAFSALESPYPGLDLVRELCDPLSLEELAWDIFAAWLAAGANPKEKWAFQALGHYGGNESARRLVPMIRAWPQESGFARAEIGLDVLCGIGTDVALMHLNGMAQKLKSKALQERAQQRLNDIAARRGLTVDELADRLVPDLDLESDGSRTLNFGPRQFRVSFDELLRPAVFGPDGKLIKDLPKPGQKDDAVLAAAAVAAFKALKKDAKAIANIQIERLEQAMAKGRSWLWNDFRLLLWQHPLMIHPVRRLLWESLDDVGGSLGTFRVAEDGSLADANDDAISPPQGGLVRIPHPLHLSGEDLKSWSELFGDYHILQPFPQLGRSCYRLAEASKADKELSVVQGLALHAGKVLALATRGWVKGEVWDGGVMCEMEKPLPGGLKAVLPVEPGIYAGALAELGDQTLGKVRVLNRSDQAQPLGQLDDLVYSELVYDLENLRSRKGGKA